ncbi:MAG: hypothetical protein F6J97_16235 [Leptolyngbya sp. SIO4C1]|nr:hypothetical protein [Leptolyngbya sp. SIO4C1]
MEHTDSLPKQQAVDGQSAFAGDPEPVPEESTVDALATEAGLDMSAGEPVQTKAKLEQRDEDRWELDPDSTQQ